MVCLRFCVLRVQAWLGEPRGRPTASDMLGKLRAMETPLDPDQSAARPDILFAPVHSASKPCPRLAALNHARTSTARKSDIQVISADPKRKMALFR